MKRFSKDMYVMENAVTSISPFNGKRSWHFLMVTFVSMLIFAAFGILSGCSGGGGGGGTTTTTSSSDTTTDDTQSYTGSAKVSGTIKLSYLSSSDKSQIDSDSSSSAKTIRPRTSKAVNTETEAVKLYVVGADGELLDTGITCGFDEDANGDRTYECDGVKDGVNYIVRYVQLNPDTDKALELTTNAYVPAGGTAQDGDGDVTPQTSVVVKALVDAILSATAGTDIDDDVVTTIIESVKTAIETLVTTGAIQVPSMVVDVDDGTTLDTLVGEDTENEKLDNTSGLILADESVDSELGVIAASTQATLFDLSTIDTAEEKTALIKKVFKELLADDGGDDDIPKIFLDFFIWHYVNNKTATVGGLLNALVSSIPYYSTLTQAQLDAVVNAAILSFNTEINNLYVLLGKDPTTLTTAEKEALADFPPIVRGLFPSTMADLTADTSIVTPQGIALVIFFESAYLPEANSDYDEDDEQFEWDEMELFSYLGMSTYIAANTDKFQGYEIFGLYLHPGSIWFQDTNEEVEALMLGTDLMDLSAFLTQSDPSVTSGVTVTLTYPKASGGTGSIDLIYITESNDWGYWGVDPWQEARMAQQTDNPTISSTTFGDRIISDFTSGDYVLTVSEGGVVKATKTFQKTVITGMLDTYVKLVSPVGMPIWPGNNASTEEWDAYNQAMAIFNSSVGFTNFVANVDTDTDDVKDKAKITASWKAPDVTLPEGVKLVYDLQLSRETSDPNAQTSSDPDAQTSSWEEIWNTWQNDKRVYTTSFTIPVLLAKTEANQHYNFYVTANFVNQATGEYLGRGGTAYTQFTVGDPIDPDAFFKIKGALSIDDSTITSSDLRVALIKETSTTTGFEQSIIKIADLATASNYSLTMQIGDILNNAGVNTWFNLILVEDASDTLVAGSNLTGVNMYWPDFSAGGMWFDTWGGILRINKDTCNTDGTCFNEEIIVRGTTQAEIDGGATVEAITGPKFYIGDGYYTAPDPSSVDPVTDLTATFTISGSVDTTGITGTAVVALIKGSYNDAAGYYNESILALDSSPGTSYTLTATVGDFYDAAGLPTDGNVDIVLIEAQSTPAVGDIINYETMQLWWQPWDNGGVWFDTWRGTNLHYMVDSFGVGTDDFTITNGSSVTGPNLSAGM